MPRPNGLNLEKLLLCADLRQPCHRGIKLYHLSNSSGTQQIWQLAIASQGLKQLTNSSDNVRSFVWNKSEKCIFYSMDKGGDENTQIYYLDPATGAQHRITRAWTSRYLYGGYREESREIIAASNRRQKACFDLVAVNIDTGEERIILLNQDNYNWPCAEGLSPNGRYLLYNKLKSQRDNALWLLDVETGVSRHIPGDARISAETLPAWTKDSRGFYYISNRDVEFCHLAYYNVAKHENIAHLSWEHDVTALALAGNGRYLALVLNVAGYSKLEIRDTSKALSLVNTLSPPQGVIALHDRLSWAPMKNELVFSFSSPTMPSQLFCLNLDKDSLERISNNIPPGLKTDDLTPAVLQEFNSFDGLRIPYWLYLPAGQKPKNLPVVIDIHGGPEEQERPNFNPLIQYLVSHGLAVVAPNVRGSTGYGQSYEALDNKDKRLNSVRDIAALVDYLGKIGLTSTDKLAVMGASYGGFMALSCLARYPELWRCGIDIVGMFNLVTFLENTSPYRRSHRESEYGSLKNDSALLYALSPAAVINQLTAPLLVIQGANDPRVPASEAEQVVAAVKERGVEVEYLLYKDEGHGLAKFNNKLDCYPRMLSFLKAKLQES